MPYVTQERPLDSPWNTPSHLPVSIRRYVGRIEIRNRTTNALASVHDLYVTLEGTEYTLGKQTTTSWRTGKSLDGLVDVAAQLSGKDLRDLILKGQDTNDGTIGGAFERGRFASPHDSGHNFSTAIVDSRNYWGPSSDQSGWCKVDGASRNVSPTFKQVLYYYGPGPRRDNLVLVLDPPDTSQRLAEGTRWVGVLAPTRPQINLARTIGELFKDGVPGLPLMAAARAGLNPAKAVGGEYLNIAFGWKPLYDDVRRIIERVPKINRQIDQMVRDSGKVVRRKAQSEALITDSWSSSSGSTSWVAHSELLGNVNLLNFTSLSSASFQRLDRKVTDSAFSGAFTYFFPDLSGGLSERLLGYTRLAELFLGLSVDPNDIYAITPWSWLIDWFADLGNVLDAQNLLTNDGLTMRYGYVSNHMIKTATQFVSGIVGLNGEPVSSSFYERKYEVKFRDRATPFGFALDPGSFTNFQWSVLIALGLASGHKIRLNEPH